MSIFRDLRSVEHRSTLLAQLQPQRSVKISFVQEGLTNISKHAAATAVQIQLQTTTTELLLVLEDNGKGFRVNDNRAGFGLQGMQERTIAVGGKIEIISAPGAGCRIAATFPPIQHLKLS